MLLQAEDLVVRYGRATALDRVSIALDEGEIATVIGANGAGKTTLLSALMGLHPLAGGRLDLPRSPGASVSVVARVEAGFALVPESRDLFGAMSVEDNLRLGAYVRRRQPADTLSEVYALFPRLAERRAQQAATLSGGERQMLALGRALMSRPRVLMLDEPSLGLAPLIVREIFEIIGSLRARGVSIILVEQNARAALAVADRAYVLESGRLTLSGLASEVACNPQVIDSYLGAQAA
jgi:branched-chain amino acid transport system ATP-binding protein